MLEPFIRVRGMFKLLVLYALKDGPLHGYGIIKKLSELTSGSYNPSPGIVYPTLQMLEDMELISSFRVGNKKLYKLTQRGIKLLQENLEEVEKLLNSMRKTRQVYEELGLRDLAEAIIELVYGGFELPKEVKECIRKRVQEIVEMLRRGRRNHA